MLDGESARRRVRTWRAGRSDLRLHLLSIFSLAVAFVCLSASLLVVTNITAVRDRWSRAGRATVYLRDGVQDAEASAIMAALRDVGFTGYMAFECGLTGPAEEALPRSVAFLKQCMAG